MWKFVLLLGGGLIVLSCGKAPSANSTSGSSPNPSPTPDVTLSQLVGTWNYSSMVCGGRPLTITGYTESFTVASDGTTTDMTADSGCTAADTGMAVSVSGSGLLIREGSISCNPTNPCTQALEITYAGSTSTDDYVCPTSGVPGFLVSAPFSLVGNTLSIMETSGSTTCIVNYSLQ